MNLQVARYLALVFAALVTAGLSASQGIADEQEGAVRWPSRWATGVARVDAADGSNELIVATADGLLLREAAVVATRFGDPSGVRELYHHPVSVWAVATAGPLIASSDYRGNLAVMNTESGQMTMHDNVLERWSRALAFAPDGKHVVAGNEGGKVLVWSVEQDEVTKTHESDPTQIYGLSFSPDGETLAVADGAGHVHLLSWPELEPGREITLGDQPIWAVAFSTNGDSVIAGGSERKLWRVALEEGSEPETIAETTDWITGVTVDSGGTVAVCTLDGTVLMMNDVRDAGAEEVAQLPSGGWGIAMPTSSTIAVATRKHAIATLGRAWTTLHAEEPAEDESESDDESDSDSDSGTTDEESE